MPVLVFAPASEPEPTVDTDARAPGDLVEAPLRARGGVLGRGLAGRFWNGGGWGKGAVSFAVGVCFRARDAEGKRGNGGEREEGLTEDSEARAGLFTDALADSGNTIAEHCVRCVYICIYTSAAALVLALALACAFIAGFKWGGPPKQRAARWSATSSLRAGSWAAVHVRMWFWAWA